MITQGDGGIHHKLGNSERVTTRMTTVDPFIGPVSRDYIKLIHNEMCAKIQKR